MKKIITFLFLFCTVVLLTACTKSYDVTFTSKDVVISTQEVEEGKKVTEVTPDPITGETFLGWYNGEELYDFSSPVKGNLNLVAKWETIHFTIIFKDYDGEILQEGQVAYNQKITAPSDPVRESDDTYDYTFSGWDKDFDTALEDLVITAEYTSTIKSFIVTFYNEDGTVNAEIPVQKGSTAGKITLTKEDDALFKYSFSGWYTEDGKKFDFKTAISEDIKLYPRFTAEAQYFETSGKTISILGDSISTFYDENSSLNSYYGGENQFYYPIYGPIKDVNNTWWQMLAKKLSATIGINNSLSGSAVTVNTGITPANSDERINTLGENGDPDIIIIYMGTNDNCGGIDAKVFKKNYEEMLAKVHAKYPNAYVFCLNLGYTAYTGMQYTEARRLEYNDVIAEICDKDTAILVDYASVQTQETYSGLLADFLHPNYDGMRSICNTTFEAMSNFFNAGKEFYFVSYVTDDTTTLEGDSVEFFYQGENLELPKAVKEGYDFLGWYLNSDFEGDAIATTGGFQDNIELYPWFEEALKDDEYRVIFKANGGLVGETDREVLMNGFLADFNLYLADKAAESGSEPKVVASIEEWGFTATLKDPDPENPNKISYTIDFDQPMANWQQNNVYNMLNNSKYAAKWRWIVDYIQAVCINNRAYVSYSDTSTWPEPLLVELYAFFKGAEVSWPGLHDTADYSQPVLLEEKAKFTDYACIKAKAFTGTTNIADLPTPVKDGYTFLGWYDNAELEGEALTEISEGCTIYAKWEEIVTE